MMYQELKLEKGMYHISGKSFSQVLEQADPSAQYADTPMEGLDAYESQLKRFEIHVAGPMCDRVESSFPQRKVRFCSRNLFAGQYAAVWNSQRCHR